MDDNQKQPVSSTQAAQNDQKPQENTVFQFVKPATVIQDETNLTSVTSQDESTQQVPQVTSDTQQAVTIPVGGAEGQPSPVTPDTTKWVEASEPQEIEVPPEAAEAGVVSSTDAFKLDEQAEQAGISYSPPVIPVLPVQESSRMELPMEEEEAKKVMAHPNPSSSRYWLAMNMLRQLSWLRHNDPEKKV